VTASSVNSRTCAPCPATTPRQARRTDPDAAVRESFETSGGRYGSPRVLADLRAASWRVTKKSVEASMARQGWWLAGGGSGLA